LYQEPDPTQDINMVYYEEAPTEQINVNEGALSDEEIPITSADQQKFDRFKIPWKKLPINLHEEVTVEKKASANEIYVPWQT
jgi:hypothetical protein